MVLTKLRQAIMEGDLEVGSRYSIYQLAERFGVSRTPVREAVLKLAEAGMLIVERNRGVRVRGLSAQDIHEIFELRLLLEVPSASSAAELRDPELAVRLRSGLERMRRAIDEPASFARHDRELHAEILRSTGNARLVRQVDALRDATQAMGVSTMNDSRSARQIVQEHGPIVEAIATGDGPAAAAAMRAHLAETRRLLMQQVGS